jgi:predicted small integral membrane protein
MSARRFFAAALLVIAAMRAHAGGAAVCSDAFIFDEAGANVVVLPYSNAIPERRDLDQTGQALSLLVQMNTLAAILKYESVGAIQLIRSDFNDVACDPDRIWRQLSARAAVKDSGLVLVWGRIFQDGDQIYVQSYARFARGKTGQESWAVSLGGASFEATLSEQATAFPTETFSEGELKEIARLTSQNAVLRETPSDDAPGERMGPDLAKCLGCVDPGRPASYVILEQNGPWAHIKNKFGQSGWLKLNTGFGAIPLGEKMPEIFFIDGTVGYLRTRKEPRTSFARAADEALARYTEAVGGQPPLGATVVAAEMRAMLAAKDPAGAERAVSLLSTAIEQSPADAALHNLLAVAKINRAVVVSKPEAPPVQDFISAAVLDPAGVLALRNLKQLLQLNPEGDGPRLLALPADEAKEQLALVDSILAKRQQ